MPVRDTTPDVVRIVEGLQGRVTIQMELIVRLDYGSVVPWVRRDGDSLHLTGGPSSLCLRSRAPTHGRKFGTVAEFEVCRPGSVAIRAQLACLAHPRPTTARSLRGRRRRRVRCAWFRDAA